MRRRDFIVFVAGAGVAWPRSARAQQSMPSLGLLSAADLAGWTSRAIAEGLQDTGFVEGRNLVIVRRSAGGQLGHLAALADDLVINRVSVILATGGPVPARTAKAATTQIPIVFAYGGDPVADGLVTSFNRPRGNITGATFIGSALSEKRLGLLREIVPRSMDVALLVNMKGTLAESQIKDANAAAQALGLRLHVIDAESESEIDEAFARMSGLKVDALLVGVDPLYGFVFTSKIVALASRYAIPTIYDSRFYVDAGGLMSYGPNLPDTWRQAGTYVGRILKGDKPSDLPIVQPTRYELIINRKLAKTLGLTVSQTLMATADEVIE